MQTGLAHEKFKFISKETKNVNNLEYKTKQY